MTVDFKLNGNSAYRKPATNKQIGNRAGEVLLLSFCARLKSSNSIQHLC